MQDHDFEKQVHQKMGEMRILPSEAVWEQVEMRLQRKERRRYWILWLTVILTGLLLGGYQVWNMLYKSSEKTIHSITAMPVTKQINNYKTQHSIKEQAVSNTDNNISKE